MELGRSTEETGDKKINKTYRKEKTDHKTTMLKFPYQHLSVQATPLLHFRHSLFGQQWLSNFLPETHTHKYILYCGPRKVSANNAYTFYTLATLYKELVISILLFIYSFEREF